MPSLTQKFLQSLNASNNGQTLSDGGNLRGLVRLRKNGAISISFFYPYRFNGKQREYSCGTWPKATLADIRMECNEARIKLADGIDPGAHKKFIKVETQAAITKAIEESERLAAENLTVEDLFQAWLGELFRANNNKEIKRAFDADLLPIIGDVPVKELTRPQVIATLQLMIARGANRSAVIMRHDLGQMFKWADEEPKWRRLMVNGNPIPKIKIAQLLPKEYDINNVRKRVLDDDEIKELKRNLNKQIAIYEKSKNKYSVERPISLTVVCAIWIMLSTLARVGETLMAKWTDIDFEKGEWFIPRINTKTKKNDFVVFLSPFSIQQFNNLKKVTGNSTFCFPSTNGKSHVCTKSVTKQIADRQSIFRVHANSELKQMSNRPATDSLVLSDSNNGKWTPHDLRRTGSTLMQKLGFDKDVVNTCLNHVLEGTKISRHYLLYEFEDEKKAANLSLGNYLNLLCEEADKSTF